MGVQLTGGTRGGRAASARSSRAFSTSGIQIGGSWSLDLFLLLCAHPRTFQRMWTCLTYFHVFLSWNSRLWRESLTIWALHLPICLPMLTFWIHWWGTWFSYWRIVLLVLGWRWAIWFSSPSRIFYPGSRWNFQVVVSGLLLMDTPSWSFYSVCSYGYRVVCCSWE